MLLHLEAGQSVVISRPKLKHGHAFMSQRIEPDDSRDFFPTPPWAGRALCEWLRDEGAMRLDDKVCWEPAAGMGHLGIGLEDYFAEVRYSDIEDYGHGYEIGDFLTMRDRRADWVVTNPPFNLAAAFIDKARSLALHGVAMIVRTSFLESKGRYENLFRDNPPAWVLQHVERVPMHKGRLERHGVTATSYCWLVWTREPRECRLRWIPPCRSRLEKDSDYQ